MAESWVFVGQPEVWTEVTRDGKEMLRVAQLTQDDDYPDSVYVRVCSWRENGEGHEVGRMIGKRVRVTVELLDD